MIFNGVELHNVAEVIDDEGGDGKLLSRLPDDLRQSLNEMAKSSALGPGGCEARFNLKGPSAKIVLAAKGTYPMYAEAFQGSFLVSWHRLSEEPTTIELSHPQNLEMLVRVTKRCGLPFDARLTRLVLPYWPGLSLLSVEGEMKPPRPSQTPKRRMLTYGSSITHGATALRPTGSYAMRLAQILGVDLINLGLGGGAHCEAQMADYIANRDDWDFALLELGINMVPHEKFDVAEFRRRVSYFIDTIASANKDKWLFCDDMFTFSADLGVELPKSGEFRKIVRQAVRQADSPRIAHFDGRHLLKNPSGLTFDLVHPAPSGMEEIARNLARRMSRVIGKS